MAWIVGTAGWSIPRDDRDRFPVEGSGLERYAACFKGVEVNSSFYRPHRATTWVRWAASVPRDFRFSVKLPKAISHERRLVGCDDILAAFLEATGGLGEKLAILLLQLPPGLRYDAGRFEEFVSKVKSATTVRLVCEPRHPSWFVPAADTALDRLEVARVAADPARTAGAAEPGGWRGLTYRRLHGSPLVYRSAYGEDRLAAIARDIAHDRGKPSWCILDNTASGAATGDSLALEAMLTKGPIGKDR